MTDTPLDTAEIRALYDRWNTCGVDGGPFCTYGCDKCCSPESATEYVPALCDALDAARADNERLAAELDSPCPECSNLEDDVQRLRDIVEIREDQRDAVLAQLDEVKADRDRLAAELDKDRHEFVLSSDPRVPDMCAHVVRYRDAMDNVQTEGFCAKPPNATTHRTARAVLTEHRQPEPAIRCWESTDCTRCTETECHPAAGSATTERPADG
jgi:hypothetical protein